MPRRFDTDFRNFLRGRDQKRAPGNWIDRGSINDPSLLLSTSLNRSARLKKLSLLLARGFLTMACRSGLFCWFSQLFENDPFYRNAAFKGLWLHKSFPFFFFQRIPKSEISTLSNDRRSELKSEVINLSFFDKKCFLPHEISLCLPFRDEECFEYLYRGEKSIEMSIVIDWNFVLRTMTRLFRELRHVSSLIMPETWIVFHACKFLLPRARLFKPCLSRFASGTSCCDKMCLRRGNSSSTITLHTNISSFF